MDKYIADAEKEAYIKQLGDAVYWLEEDGWDADTETLQNKLTEVQEGGLRMFALREAYTKRTSQLQSYSSLLDSYARVKDIKHLDADEKKVVADEVVAARAWITEVEGKLAL